MNRIARSAVYVALLLLGLSMTPTRIYGLSLNFAAVGILALVLLQLRTTKNPVDYALARLALGCLGVVYFAPLLVLGVQ
ncbi:hypothetical protein [Streptomyces sp. NBC_00425]|uniref:hypothetical protein n=1 Tax=Streptomyces sp. NBC_00425 TaxID=2975740 RepID=UPI002E21324B